MFKNTGSLDHLETLGILKEGQNYFSLVGDPCYRFSREVKENFFKNLPCAILFKIAVPHLHGFFAGKKATYKNIIIEWDKVVENILNKARVTLG